MNVERLNKWSDLLLDTGKRNNLINFRDTKIGTVEILAPDFDTLFSMAQHSNTFEVYDPHADDDLQWYEVWDDDENYRDMNVTKEQYYDQYAHKLKKQSQILMYSRYLSNPLRALMNIDKKSRTAIEENGVNIAYMAFGFVVWSDAHSKTEMKAPLLLVPISIVNESPIEPTYIKVTDDDIIVNPTFSFKLMSEYGIKVPDYDEDEGIDSYVDRVTDAIERLKWTVVKECKIGIFSFLKINMYKDLKDNVDRIVRNPNVGALLRDNETVERIEHSGVTDYSDQYNVVDADSSQSEAIAMARIGKSFVLQGPPGTGKSQTITNVIAECLAAKKKVLFVSEKLAALSVVYDKLKRAGLTDYCLELHSHKANKKEVINELVKSLRIDRSSLSDRAKTELEIRNASESELDSYARELHEMRPVIGKSLYMIYEELSAVRNAPEVDYTIEDIEQKGLDYVENAESLLSEYASYTRTIGRDYRLNEWYGYANLNNSYGEILRMKKDLATVVNLAKMLLDLADAVKARYGMEATTLNRIHAVRKLMRVMRSSRFITPTLLTEEIAPYLERVNALRDLAVEIRAMRRELDSLVDPEIYAVDVYDCYRKLTRVYTGGIKRAFSGEYREIMDKLRLLNRTGKKLGYDEAVSLVTKAYEYNLKTEEYRSLEGNVSEVLSDGYAGVDIDWDMLYEELESISEITATGVDYSKLKEVTTADFLKERRVLGQFESAYNMAFEKSAGAEERLGWDFDLTECDVCSMPLVELIDKCSGCLASADKIDNWCEFTKLLERIKSAELKGFLDVTLDGNVKPRDLVSAFKRIYYTQWADTVMHDSPTLIKLTRVPHDETVERFNKKDELIFEINKAKIRSILSDERPDTEMVAQGSAVAILLREGEKKRKQKPVRTLLMEIGDLVQTLKPCFLMSPLSVSTYLSPEMEFDVVIFDEASQIFPQDAIGAIYRGKQLVVVGDSRQMPPSNFFNTVASLDDEDEDYEDIADYESILDLATTAFPQRRLRWHYRSRYEHLIAFSNKNFYDNELVTFPSATEDREGVGVDYHHADGIFDRKTKTNRIEAEKVVELVFEHFRRYPDRSLGVVAFSISQQSMIESMIARRRRMDPSLETYFRSDRPEPFFVKNLETVQGDERDTIIFSVAYAKDKDGKLYLNFGPINKEGGERRLNVAVTRAKINVQLVTSMHATDIVLSRTKSVGARLMREYLDYAEHGETALKRTVKERIFERKESSFVAGICEFLRGKGFVVETGKGTSVFKIDVAVKHPRAEGYLMAIECDGDVYRNSPTARDRDRLRREVLEGMGWHYYRIWSPDWFRSRETEEERLIIALRDAMNERAPIDRDEEEVKEISFEERQEVESFEFPIYEMADLNVISRRYRELQYIVRAMLEVEAPLSEEWMLKRIAYLFGREKVTQTMLNEYEELMTGCRNIGIIRRNGFLYLEGKEVPILRVPEPDALIVRDARYVSVEELARGLRELIRLNVTVERNGLFRLVAHQLGLARIGDVMMTRLESALALIEDEVETNGDMLSLRV